MFILLTENIQEILKILDLKKIIKVFLFISLSTLSFFASIEIIIFFSERPNYLVTILEKYITNDQQYLSNIKPRIENNFQIDGSFGLNEIRNHLFVAKFILSTFLSNPITFLLSFSLLYFLFCQYYKNNVYSYLVLFLVLIFGLFTASKLYFIFLFFIVIQQFSLIKQKIFFIVFLCISSIFLILLFYYFIDLKNISLIGLYFSRWIFYEQFFSQIDLNYIARLNFDEIPIFYNIDYMITGPHSDIIYIISNFGLIYLFLFIYMIYNKIKFNLFSCYLIVVSLFNGILLNLFVWIFLIISFSYEINNNYTDQK